MKTKLFAAILSLTLLLGLGVSAGAAAPHSSLRASAYQVSAGETVHLTVSMSGTEVSSLGVTVTCTDGLEVTGGQWLQAGLMTSFDMSKHKGVYTTGGAGVISGDIFRLTLRASKTGTATVTLIGKNGTQTVFQETYSAAITIPCVSHSWDAGTVTSQPSCSREGTKRFTCTACGEVRTEALEKLSCRQSQWTADPQANVEKILCLDCGKTLQTRPLPQQEQTPPAENTQPEAPNDPPAEDATEKEPDTGKNEPGTGENIPTTDTGKNEPATPPAATVTQPKEESPEPPAQEQETVIPEVPEDTQEAPAEKESPLPEEAPVEKAETTRSPQDSRPAAKKTELSPVILAVVAAAAVVGFAAFGLWLKFRR